MRVNSRFLYWGVLFVALGGVLVASELRAVDTATLTDSLRLWPLAVIAIGLSLVLRRTRFSLPGLLLAAALPGLVLGGALAVAPRFAGDCGARNQLATVLNRQGTFDGPASVSIRSGCGTLNVTTAPGNGWRLNAGNTTGRTPQLDSSARSLSIDADTEDGLHFLDTGRDDWDLTLPTTDIDEMALVMTASRGQVDLPGAHIDQLALKANAAEIVIDASKASIAELDAVVNVGALRIRLPETGDVVGSVRVGAGDARICTPFGMGLRVTNDGMAEMVRVNGQVLHAEEWQSPDFETATYSADLDINVKFGAVAINPIGGCS
jgi:hypothetical protein